MFSLASEREQVLLNSFFSCSRAHQQKFLVSFNFPIVALDGKFAFPQTLSFFSSLPSGLILFLIYPHTLAFPRAFVGVIHRGNAFPQFQCLRHKQRSYFTLLNLRHFNFHFPPPLPRYPKKTIREMLNIASLGMRFNLHNVKCRFARYAFKKSMPHSHVPVSFCGG